MTFFSVKNMRLATWWVMAREILACHCMLVRRHPPGSSFKTAEFMPKERDDF